MSDQPVQDADTVRGDEGNDLSPKEERRLIADCAMWARRAERAEAKLAARNGLLREGRGVLGSDLAVSEGGSGVRIPSPDDPPLPQHIDGLGAGGSMEP